MENLGFWAAASALALGVAGLLILSLLAARRADPAPVAARDLQVYRDQLREVERDLKRGTLAAAEAERLRTEIARRLLDADRGANRGAARQAAAPTRAGGA
ncbi:c-type cytochrome biogenesis protein CcmI, partial [Pseudogemmobacter sonorensis]|uniref:c-type cytochrome biogenesis protein CcmI n=1 Tax=Pseudogemmobacter sonorensis TaxID=2989681 RepID=UPI0036CAE654